jgi:DNA excision repair protein ERCC-6-like 2
MYDLCRTKDATAAAVELGNTRAMELSAKLQQVYLRRSKEVTLAGFLPKKDERIIFCELSPLQKELYKFIIEQPDFIVLRQKNAPCDCGVNRKVRCTMHDSTRASGTSKTNGSFRLVFP